MNQGFGAALRQIRKAKNIRLVDLSRKTELARSHLYRIENGETNKPGTDTLNRLALALEVEPEELYELCWDTTGEGPDLPSLQTYFKTKYGFSPKELAQVEAAIEPIIERRYSG